MDHSLLVISSPPRSAEARRALHLAGTLRAQGRPVAIVLLQDAVLAAVEAGALAGLLRSEVPVYAAARDLALRGFSRADVVRGVEAVDDRRLVDIMLADGTRTAGTF